MIKTLLEPNEVVKQCLAGSRKVYDLGGRGAGVDFPMSAAPVDLFDDGTFDAVYSGPVTSWFEADRLLRTGGRLIYRSPLRDLLPPKGYSRVAVRETSEPSVWIHVFLKNVDTAGQSLISDAMRMFN